MPKASVVKPPGTSAFEPASIVGLDAVSWMSKETGTPLSAKSGLAQMLPSPESGLLEPAAAHTSLKLAVSDPPSDSAKPAISSPGESSATIELASSS